MIKENQLPPQQKELLRYKTPTGEIKSFDAAEVTERGTMRAVRFMEQAVCKKNTVFNRGLLDAMHTELFYFFPEMGARIRPVTFDQNGEIMPDKIGFAKREGDRLVQNWKELCIGGEELDEKFNQYGEWLAIEVERIRHMPDDLLASLHLACEAHYSLMSPYFHPYADGNGRLARLLLNGILMINTHELMYYGINILPVPLLRQKTQRNIASIDEWKDDPYLVALRTTDETNDLTDLEVLIAGKWSENISAMLKQMEKIAKHESGKRTADEELLEIFHKRKYTLDQFVLQHGKESWQKGELISLPVSKIFTSKNDQAA